MNKINLASPAHVMRDALRQGVYSSVSLTKAMLARIAELNPVLNAIVVLDEAGALAAAAQSDMRISAGNTRALEGLPITIKDAFDVAGMVSSAGLPAYKERVPAQDAAAVARLRAAGVVILGKSNVPVFSGDFQSYNPHFGVTNHPLDITRSPGGSSGGAAVAVLTGMTAFELGSDLGSSIRWPAHACGVFGLKTSWGLVSTWGAIPPPPERRLSRNADLMVAGPITRSAADMAMVLDVIAGPRDINVAHAPLKPPRNNGSPKGLRVAVWCEDPFAKADASVVEGVMKAAQWLEQRGAIIDASARPGFRFKEAYAAYALLNHAVVAYGLPPKIRLKLQSMASQFAPNDTSHRALQAHGARMTPGLFQQVQQRLMSLKRQWARFFECYDVVLCPPAPVLAIRHDHSPDIHARTLDVNGEKRPYLDFLIWGSLATGADLPAAVAPVDLSSGGLPRGVQIIAPFGEDLLAIAVAGMIEEAAG